jgi:hypothetical protein
VRVSVFLTLVMAAAAATACDVRVNDKGVSVLPPFAGDAGRAEDEWSRSYTLAKGGTFEIQSDRGDIEVMAATGNAVEVKARREVRARSDDAARELLKQLTIDEEITPDRVRVQARRTEGMSGFRRVAYEIRVPAGLSVSIKNENGSVRLTNVHGRFNIGSTNGRVMGRSVSGGLEVQTVNGIVIMQMASVSDDIRITTVNGHAILGLPPTLNATIEASAVNGGVIVIDTLPVVSTTKDRQHLSGRLGTGNGPRIELRTTNGNVRLGGGEPPT